MKKILFLLLLATPVHAEGPLFRHKDKVVSQEFENVYQDMRTIAPRVPARTKAQLQALAPSRAGLIFYCSDCSTDGVVVSTGTGVGAFGRISARTTAIN